MTINMTISKMTNPAKQGISMIVRLIDSLIVTVPMICWKLPIDTCYEKGGGKERLNSTENHKDNTPIFFYICLNICTSIMYCI